MFRLPPPGKSVGLLFLIFSCFTSILCYAQGSGGAILLDGINDYALFDNNNRGITDQLTVEAWIKTNSLGHHHVVSKYDRDTENGFQLLVQNGKACLAGRDGSGNYRMSGYSTSLVTDNKWHHLAGVVQDGTWIIYVDGILQNQQVTGYTNTVLNSNENLLIGNYYYEHLGNHFYEGQIDEVRIWKKALSADDIRKNMCLALPTSSLDLVAYFNFDEAGSGTVKDKSNQRLDGTLQNMNASVARRTSGAPIGDKSAYNYTSNWQGQVTVLSEEDDTFTAVGQDTRTQAIHIYHVAAAPNTTAGLTDANQAGGYFGVFRVGTSGAAYSVQYSAEVASCSQSLYRRPGNAGLIWAKVAEASLTDPLTHSSNEAQGEYVVIKSDSRLASIQSTGDFCSGTAATLSIDASGTVLWSTGETSKSISVRKGGEYTVVVTDKGCAYTDKVTVREVPLPSVDLGPDRILCAGEVAKLEAPAGNAYLWSTGATSSSIEVSDAGEYWVEVTNSGGCVVKDAIRVTANPQPDFPLKEEIMVCYGEQVLLDATTANASYIWSNGQTTASITVTAPSDMQVAVTVAGCTYTRNIRVSGVECPVIPNIITPNGDGKNDALVALGVEKKTMKLQIFNRWGKPVFQSEQYEDNWSAPDMPAGMYYYQFTSLRTQKIYKGWVEVLR